MLINLATAEEKKTIELNSQNKKKNKKKEENCNHRRCTFSF